jgi:hypothetical protein
MRLKRNPPLTEGEAIVALLLLGVLMELGGVLLGVSAGLIWHGAK